VPTDKWALLRPSIRRRCPFLRLHYSDWPNARAGFIYAFDISARPRRRFQQKRIPPALALCRFFGECQARWVPRGGIIKSRARACFLVGKAHFFVDQMAKLRRAAKLECWGEHEIRLCDGLKQFILLYYTHRRRGCTGR